MSTKNTTSSNLNEKKKAAPPVAKKKHVNRVQTTQIYTPEELAEKRRKFVEERCTKLLFIRRDEARTREEKLIEDRPIYYSDLQRFIAKFTPKSNEMYVVYDMDDNIIGPHNFKPAKMFKVLEMFTNRMTPEFYPKVPVKWEFYNYSGGRPKNWVDMMEQRRRAKFEADNKEKQQKKAENLLRSLEDDD